MTKTPTPSWQRVTELFEQAVDLPAKDRPDFLRSACAGDRDLLHEVESLLAEHEADADFLESPAVAAVATQIHRDTGSQSIGRRLGHYQIEALLGRGGMGEVYIARDKLGRRVALKLL